MFDKVKKSAILNFGLLILVGLVGYGSFKLVREALFLNRESRSNQEKIEELTAKKQELEAYLAELSTEEAIKREAKERLNLKEPGEKVVVVAPDEGIKKENGEERQSFWGRIRSLFASIWINP